MTSDEYTDEPQEMLLTLVAALSDTHGIGGAARGPGAALGPPLQAPTNYYEAV